MSGCRSCAETRKKLASAIASGKVREAVSIAVQGSAQIVRNLSPLPRRTVKKGR